MKKKTYLNEKNRRTFSSKTRIGPNKAHVNVKCHFSPRFFHNNEIGSDKALFTKQWPK